MLAAMGFTATGICFGIFGYTFYELVVRKAKLGLQKYSYAYYCLGLAMLVWGIAVAIGGNTILKQSVIVGDGLLLLGTIFMLELWLGEKYENWSWLAVVASMALLILRATELPPNPYMKGGILIFNTQTPAAIILGIIFVGIWLPVNLKVAKFITHKIKQDIVSNTYAAIYVTATLAALIFIAARRTITVILSFAAIGISFALLIWSNILIAKLTEKKHGKHA